MEKPTARILTGTLKGKKIALPDDAAVRPTRERVRAAVFNMLESRIHFDTQRVVDLCCGSGAWGLEAFSRGAYSVTLVDKDVRSVKANVAALGLQDKVEVVQGDVLAYAPKTLATLVLADPPYDSDLLSKMLERGAMVAEQGAIWAIEYATGKAPALPCVFEEMARKTHGSSEILLLRYEG
jgi:16S rRNA (guanine966-N2)-methyltransferase